MTLPSPYIGLPASAFWRTGVAEVAYPPPGLYAPRFRLAKTDRIVTAGSCFAQHVGRTLRQNGYNVVDKEPVADDPRMIEDQAETYGYGLYSARYGNIYSARQMKQILLEALGQFVPTDLVWERNGRFFDSMRPNIEPDGFATEAALRVARDRHLQRVREAFTEADVFVFTLGLTEAWTHRATGQVYATAPGTIAGSYDPQVHEFKNFRHSDIMADLRDTLQLLKEINPSLRMLMTVSPVPLTATATGDHVLAATTYSKSVLRACAGEIRDDYPEIDYFPSYEIITSVRAGSSFFASNLRSVTADGVAFAMKCFVDAHLNGGGEDKAVAKRGVAATTLKARKAEAHPVIAAEPEPKVGALIHVAGIAVPDSPYSARPAFLARAAALGDDKPEDISCAEAVVQVGDRVLQIGANLGIVTAYLAKTGLPGAIRAYEANEDRLLHIRSLYTLNAVDHLIELRQAQVFPQSMNRTARGKGAKSSAATVATDTVMFPNIVAEFSPNVLVIDTMGEEVDFLLKADLRSLRAIAIRWHPKITPVDDLRKCKRHLKAAGFKVIAPVSTRMTWAITREA